MIGLTEHQRRLVEFIRTYMARSGGVSPSYVQMQEALGLSSKSCVHRLVTALEERGAIQRLPGRARAIEIVAPLTVDLTNVPLHALLAELALRGHRPLRPNGDALPSGHNLPEPLTAPPAIGGSGPSDVSPFHVPEVTDV